MAAGSIKAGTVVVRGATYHWRVHRQPTWTSDRVILGLAILVESDNANSKPLLLQFEVDRTRHRTMLQHQRARVPESRLAACIEEALDGGWNPESRGKVFVFDSGPITPKQ